mgnify:CR=1 FL=1
MRILIVDDSRFMRSALRRVLQADPTITVVGEAQDGRDAIHQARTLKPDVVTLDVEMPVLDGLGALKEIVKLPEAPAVLMCSSLTAEGSDAALRALAAGAADVIAKSPPGSGMGTMGPELVEKVLAIGESVRRRRALKATSRSSSAQRSTANRRSSSVEAWRELDPSLLVIGSSTGGPPVLETLLKALKPGFRMPVVVAQHMPRPFTERMSARLRDVTRLDVRHVEGRTNAEPGVVYIAPGGTHTHMKRSPAGTIVLTTSDEPADHLYKPSVDVLFRGAADVARKGALGIVLTGMGRDGAEGAQALVNAGGRVLTQSEASCVVYGMPKAVDDLGISAASLDPSEMADALGAIGLRSAA